MNEENQMKIIITILRIFAIIFVSIFIIQILIKLFGHSPQEMQLLYGGLASLAILFIGIAIRFSYKLGSIDQHLLSIDSKIEKIENKMESFEKRFNSIEKRLIRIENKI